MPPAATAVTLQMALTGIGRVVCGHTGARTSVVAKASPTGVVFLAVIPTENRPKMYRYLAQQADLEVDLVQFDTLYIALNDAWNVIRLSRAAAEESLRLSNDRVAKN
jgi:hypothetical protein